MKIRGDAVKNRWNNIDAGELENVVSASSYEVKTRSSVVSASWLMPLEIEKELEKIQSHE